jgi:hypothetical protein
MDLAFRLEALKIFTLLTKAFLTSPLAKIPGKRFLVFSPATTLAQIDAVLGIWGVFVERIRVLR